MTDANARYRQTKDPNNPWKVCLESSGEGKGSITTFWLEIKSGKNVSTGVNVKQGDPAKYSAAYNDANAVTVYLTGQNNNYSSAVYNVSGFWDEETN